MLRINEENREEKKEVLRTVQRKKRENSWSTVAQEEKDRGAGRQRQLHREIKPTRGWALLHMTAKVAAWGLRQVQSSLRLHRETPSQINKQTNKPKERKRERE